MMKNYPFILTLILFLSLNCPSGFASDPIAFVIKSQNMPDYPAGHEMPENTVIETTDKQRLALKTNSGDTVVIGENSNFKLVNPGFFSHLFGKIYYFIQSRKAENSLKIKSSVATIGIRGTKFIIASDDNENGQISLAEGLLHIESNDEEPFAITSRKELTEFERYKLESLKEMQSINNEYENYKKGLEQEFLEYKQSFELTENNVLSFDGKKVEQTPLGSLQKEEMQAFEEFIQDIQ